MPITPVPTKAPRTRKPRIEYYWTSQWVKCGSYEQRVNWRLLGINGEVMCQSTQGFRDKTDAQRSVDAVRRVFWDDDGALEPGYREVGPGRKPEGLL